MKRIWFLLALVVTISCSMTDEEKIARILSSDELYIQQNTYGGLAGYHEQYFHIKQSEYEGLMIIDEGTDYQTFVRMDEKRELLKAFLKEAVESTDSEKTMSNSCVTGIDSEYIIKSGLTKLTLRPNAKCDSIFNLIVTTE